jgi:hypothetical protein
MRNVSIENRGDFMKIARVFPRITKATPKDEYTFSTEEPPMMILPEIDEVHVSVTFTFDKAKAEDMAENWRKVGVPVKVDGPAYDNHGEEFIPGMYLKEGFTISSRGCNNKCWFCDVWRREGTLRELLIKEGWIIQDNNLLACSEAHTKAVFEMLGRQKKRPIFSGGLEAKILKPWHVELLLQAKPQEMFFAYDTPDDYEPLIEAGKMLKEAGFTIKSRVPRAYVLMGYPNDTKEAAEQRCIDTLKAGFIPFGMLYTDKQGNKQTDWHTGWDNIQRRWSRQAIIYNRHKEYFI